MTGLPGIFILVIPNLFRDLIYTMHYLIGVLLILISGSSFGTLAIFARLAYEDGVTPTSLLFLRFGIASLCMLLAMLIKGIPLPRGWILLGLALMGGIGYVGQAFSYFTALTLIPAGLVALLLYLYPAIVTILAVIILKERISKWKIIALLIALGGTVLTIGPTGGGQFLGVLFGLGAAFIYSIYILVGSKITKQVTAIQSSTVVIVSAAIVSGGLVTIKGPAFPETASGWASVIAIALISTILAIVTFFAGLERVGPTNASTLSTVEPAVTVVLAAMVLGEAISFMRILGGIMIILAVIILAKSEVPIQEVT
jgi:drug/metabolite transporter (DMT)-like permease